VNCNSVRKLLLQVETSDQLPASAQEHLAACAECRAWQRKLVRLEAAVPRLPVTQSTARVDFLCRFLAEGAAGAPEGRSDTPRDRIGALADLAENLHAETRNLAASADSEALAKLARLYEHVVLKGMVEAAQKLPPEQCRQTLAPIIDRLAQTRRDVDRLAKKGPGTSAKPLQLIARAAQDSDYELRALIEKPKRKS
jgi:hypothetical protein